MVRASRHELGRCRQSRRSARLPPERDGYTETRPAPPDADLLPPIESQEVWAAGVTYYRSRTARMEESKTAGGGDFYDRVYAADRPELFFKATPHRVRGHGQAVRIRSDASWNVPEPELTLAVTSSGHDRRLHHRQRHELARHRGRESALPAAGEGLRRHHARLGPGILVTPEPLGQDTEIALRIVRAGATAFEGTTTLAAMKRAPEELVRLSVSRQPLSRGQPASDRHRHRAARRLHAGERRRGRDHHRADRHARQSRPVTTDLPLVVWAGRWSVSRLPPDDAVPEWAHATVAAHRHRANRRRAVDRRARTGCA